MVKRPEKAPEWKNINKISYQTAGTDLLELEEKKWLKSVKKEKTFYFVPADKLLTTS